MSLERSACSVAADFNLGFFHSVAGSPGKIFMGKCKGKKNVVVGNK